ncbi:MAG: TIGR00303 family protein, partial [Cyanobacteria bacterium J06632_22]
SRTPLSLVAAVGDPMQITAAGMALGASTKAGVLLAGGSQMMAVYALVQALHQWQQTQLLTQPKLTDEPITPWDWPETALKNIVVGTTRWVLEDASSDTVGLADLIGVPLLNTQLTFADARFEQLRRFEQGYVKEGVGAGGCAIAAQLYQNWSIHDLVKAIEQLLETCLNQASH